MLDQEFCEFLEYRLSDAFGNSEDVTVKYFWCDGVWLPSSEKLSAKNVNDKRQLVTTAFIGTDGQDRYELILAFGPKALSRYARGLDIKECVPSPEENSWYEIDQGLKRIIVYLL